MTKEQLQRISRDSYAKGTEDVLSVLKSNQLGPAGAMIAEAIEELLKCYEEHKDEQP